MNLIEVQELEREVASEYEKDREAIRRVISLLQKRNGSNGAGKHEAKPESQSDADTVRKAVSDISGQFSMRDVVARVGASVETKGISTALFGMVKRGELTVIQAGRGRKPAIYGKPQTTN